MQLEELQQLQVVMSEVKQGTPAAFKAYLQEVDKFLCLVIENQEIFEDAKFSILEHENKKREMKDLVSQAQTL